MGESWSVSSRASKAEKELIPLREEKKRLDEQAKQIREGLTNEQRQVLAAGHSLINRKLFSWSRLFIELEAILPNNVKVTRIDVRNVFVRDGRMIADLEFAVMSKSDTAVTNMIAEMDRTGVFQTELTGQDLRKENNSTVMEWTMRVIYMPRVGVPIGDANKNTTQSLTANNGGEREQ